MTEGVIGGGIFLLLLILVMAVSAYFRGKQLREDIVRMRKIEDELRGNRDFSRRYEELNERLR